MLKLNLINTIMTQLTSKGIPAVKGIDSDIEIETTFLDAGWSTGKKKIQYQANILINEQQQTIYMYEKTSEKSDGFSFGASGSSFTQSGKTLFRKIKSIQYGPDGKAYEYNLDLGDIVKTVKNTAQTHGYKFKTVIRKKKAMFDDDETNLDKSDVTKTEPNDTANQTNHPSADGHASFCTSCGAALPPHAKFCDACGTAQQGTGNRLTNQQTADTTLYASNHQKSDQKVKMPPSSTTIKQTLYDQEQPTRRSPRKHKKGRLGLIGLAILALFTIVLLYVMSASILTWLASITVLVVMFAVSRILPKGIIMQLIIIVMTAFGLLMAIALTGGGEVSLTTATIKNAHMTTMMDTSGKPVDIIETYTVDAPQLVAVAELRNAPMHTQVHFVWIYISEETLIADYQVDSGENEANVYVFSTLTNNQAWPLGDYEVQIFVEDRTEPDDIIKFKIE